MFKTKRCIFPILYNIRDVEFPNTLRTDSLLHAMASSSLQLKCYIMPSNVFASFLFEPQTLVSEVCRAIRGLPGAAQGQFIQFGLFKAHDDYQKCQWLDMEKSLSYYHVKNGDMLFYRNKLRPLRVRTLENFVKIVQVDDSRSVAEVTRTVCSKIGLPDYQEYSFTLENDSGEAKPPSKDKVEKKRKKYHLGEALNWLSAEKSLREQGITETTVVTLRKKYFFSDQNVDQNDFAQLNLLYAQSRDAILDSTHPCSKKEAIILAALQCLIQYGGYDKIKHVPGYLNLSEFLPAEYLLSRDVENSVLKQCMILETINPVEAMLSYIKLCQSLPTYGVTLFPTKQRLRGKLWPTPCLLGIKKDAVLVLDVKTKDTICSWSTTIIQKWGFNTKIFSLITSSGQETTTTHIFETAEGEAISQLIRGYVDITLKMTPMYETIPDNPMQGSLPKKPETKPLDADGYLQIIDAVSDNKIHANTQVNSTACSSSSNEEEGYIIMQQRNAKKEFKVQVSELLMTTPTILSHPDPLLANSLQDTTAGLGDITLATSTKDPQHSIPNLLLDPYCTTLCLQHPMKGNTSDLQNTTLVLQGIQEPSLGLQNIILPFQGTSLGSEPKMPGLQDIPLGLQDSTMTASHNTTTSCLLNSTMGSITGSQNVTSGLVDDTLALQEATLGLEDHFKRLQGSEHTSSDHIDSSSHPLGLPRKLSLPVLDVHSTLHLFHPSSSLPYNARITSPNHLKLHKFHSLSEVESKSSLQIPPFQPCPLSSPHPLPSLPTVPASTPPNVSPCPPALLLPFPYLPPKFQTHSPSHSPSPPPLPPKPSPAFFPEEPPRYLPFPISNAPQSPVSSETMEDHNGNGCCLIQNKQVQQTGTESVTTTE